jgi:hypothetical protein
VNVSRFLIYAAIFAFVLILFITNAHSHDIEVSLSRSFFRSLSLSFSLLFTEKKLTGIQGYSLSVIIGRGSNLLVEGEILGLESESYSWADYQLDDCT